MTSVVFQSILRKQIRKLPKILNSDSVKIIQYDSILFIRVLSDAAGVVGRAGEAAGPADERLARRRVREEEAGRREAPDEERQREDLCGLKGCPRPHLILAV